MSQSNFLIKKIRNQAKSGSINNFFYERLIEACKSDDILFINKSIDSAIHLSSIGVNSFGLFKKYKILKNILKEKDIKFNESSISDMVVK